MDAARGAPEAQIAPGNLSKSPMQLDADDLAKRHLGGEENGAAHSGADINEGEVGDGCGRSETLPATDQTVKDGRRNTVVGGRVPIVTIAALEVTAGNEPAGAYPVGHIEGVTHEAVGH